MSYMGRDDAARRLIVLGFEPGPGPRGWSEYTMRSAKILLPPIDQLDGAWLAAQLQRAGLPARECRFVLGVIDDLTPPPWQRMSG